MSTFLRSQVNLIGDQGQKRGKPKIPHEVWNKNSQVLALEEITSNSSENWNSVSKSSLPQKPNIWYVVQSFQKEDAGARYATQKHYFVILNIYIFRVKVLQHATGSLQDPHPTRTKKILEKKKKLSSVVEQYGYMKISDWLDAMQTVYE